MANIARFDPFGDSLDEMFRRFFKPARWEGDAAIADMRIDVDEAETAYSVKAEIPGAKKEDISVRIDGNQVSIAAETKREKEVKQGGKTIRSERYYGNLSRSFTLGHEVDRETATAKYVDGILELTLPKKPGGSSKSLTIN